MLTASSAVVLQALAAPSVHRSNPPFQPHHSRLGHAGPSAAALPATASSSSSSTPPGYSRRDALLLSSSLVVSQLRFLAAAESAKAGGIGRYIKQKRLDPLTSYVPLLLEARAQLADAGEVMRTSSKGARILLRSGPFNGLRESARAVGEYAEEAGQSGTNQLVADLFRCVYVCVRPSTPPPVHTQLFMLPWLMLAHAGTAVVPLTLTVHYPRSCTYTSHHLPVS